MDTKIAKFIDYSILQAILLNFLKSCPSTTPIKTAEIQQIETVIEKEVNILKTWQKVLMWLGAMSVIIVIGYLLIKLSTILSIVGYNGIK